MICDINHINTLIVYSFISALRDKFAGPVVFQDAFCRSSHRKCSVKKGVLKNLANFTGKHLCCSLFYNKVSGLRSATPFL